MTTNSTNGVIQNIPDFAPLIPNFDIIGIDRRGTGYTTPTLKCFNDNDERNAWIQSEPAVLGSSKAATRAHRERAKKFAKQCGKLSGDALKWMGTYPSAVDIHTVMKAIGEKKINFHGFSSGTHTAHTFAALYPEAVGKFVLDGKLLPVLPTRRLIPLAVVRSDIAYTIIDNQPDSIVDAELDIEGFFITCAAAGNDACPFLGSSTTAAQLKSRFSAIDKKLKEKSVVNPGFKPFDYSAFHRFLTVVVQDSGTWYPRLADLLVDLEAGKQGPGLQYVSGVVFANPPSLPPLDATPPFEQIQAAICIDAATVSKNSKDFDRYLASMIKTSPSVGGVLAQTNLYCTEWNVKPANRFPVHQVQSYRPSQFAGKVLYVSNTADPFCPLDSAYYMKSRYFKDKATIAIDHAAGHTSIVQGTLSGLTGFPSLGIFDIIYRFMNLEQTPASGSVYLPDLPPFIDRGAGYKGLLPSGFGGVKAPAYPVPGKTPPA